MVTMHDIAVACGVSRSTVSLVLNGREKELGITPRTRDEILHTARRLRYCRNELARAVVTGKSRVVAMVFVADTEVDFTQRIINGALRAASGRNYSVKLFQPGDGDRGRVVRTLREQKIAGVLCHGATLPRIRPWLEAFRRAELPCGVLNLPNPTGIGFGLHSDDVAGMAAVIKYLGGLGHRRIACATVRDHPYEYNQARRRGYLEGMARLGAEPRFLEGVSQGFESNLALLTAVLDEAPARRPTAFACTTDYLASEVFHAAYRKRLWVPDDLSIVGYGGLHLAEALPAPLTTVRQPFGEMGYRAMALLLDAVEAGGHPESVDHVMNAELAVRDSCRPAVDGRIR